jgi:hypothetical protein
MRGYRIESCQGWGKKLAYARMKRCADILAVEMNYVKISAQIKIAYHFRKWSIWVQTVLRKEVVPGFDLYQLRVKKILEITEAKRKKEEEKKEKKRLRKEEKAREKSIRRAVAE